ncbi:MAG: pseudouridine synthase [Desulfobacteraceae bacterium]|jgi:23S rRNA pseudouridine2605 synthase/23S rRNA pseudouridine2604 synthase
MTLVRLQKLMSEAGICSRRRAEKYIVAGRVRVNGQIVTQLGTKVDAKQDQVEFDGQMISTSTKLIYVVLNKPLGVVTSCSHPGERVVTDLVDLPYRLYPVGRLDKDSTGLLLLTNDGMLHHRLSHPSFDHEKEYLVTVAHSITDGALEKMAQGMPLMGIRTRPTRIRRLSPTRFRITLKEGRNRQIRRMVRKVGNSVIGLTRIRIANIHLGNLAEGMWRPLTIKERMALLALVKFDSKKNIYFGSKK